MLIIVARVVPCSAEKQDYEKFILLSTKRVRPVAVRAARATGLPFGKNLAYTLIFFGGIL